MNSNTYPPELPRPFISLAPQLRWGKPTLFTPPATLPRVLVHTAHQTGGTVLGGGGVEGWKREGWRVGNGGFYSLVWVHRGGVWLKMRLAGWRESDARRHIATGHPLPHPSLPPEHHRFNCIAEPSGFREVRGSRTMNPAHPVYMQPVPVHPFT
jgi:hypothetical protein